MRILHPQLSRLRARVERRDSGALRRPGIAATGLGTLLALWLAAAGPAMGQKSDPGAPDSTAGTAMPSSNLPAATQTGDGGGDTTPAAAGAPAGPAAAAPKYDPGAGDGEIKIGNTLGYSGPLAVYGITGKTITAYFDKINAEGGVNGRKIRFISYDDGYDPRKTVELTHRLVEEDQVLLMFASLGTATNMAVRGYLNEKKVPQLFVASGDSRWDSPSRAPWSMGWSPNYRTEGRIYGQYLVANHPKSKIAVLYQNDDYGKDYLQGMKDGLAGKLPIVAAATYEATDTSIQPQLQKLKASGADVFFDVTTPKFTIQAIRTLPQIGWKPLHIINTVSNSPEGVLKPAGLDNAQGILSGYYIEDVANPVFKDHPGVKDWNAFAEKNLPPAVQSSPFAVYGYLLAETLVEVLKQCGNDLTRDNIMRQAASLKGLKLPLLVSGVAINTSASDYAPIEQMQIARVVGERFEPFGAVLSGVDPGAVSEGLKSIFRFGSATQETATSLNKNTVAMMTGTLGGTYEEIGADLATVLDNGDKLRVLPILGRGSVQGVADILYLKGVDIGIVRGDTLDYLERNGYAQNIRPQFAYITKLFNEEMHIIAPKTIDSIGALDGKTVAVGLSSGGTFVTAINVFERLGIRPHFLYVEQRVALDKLRKGEIDALIAVEAKPVASISDISDANLHFVPVDYSTALQADYLPGTLTPDDYPGLIPKGGRVHTISVASVLAAYNWPAKTDHYRRLEHFVDAFFSKLPELQQPPFHPKWRDVSLNAKMAGWTRFQPAEEWLQRHPVVAEPVAAESSGSERQPVAAANPAQEREALFREFLEWRKSKSTSQPQ
jgi:branched-chain amino acid transport system substrate-binding protein